MFLKERKRRIRKEKKENVGKENKWPRSFHIIEGYKNYELPKLPLIIIWVITSLLVFPFDTI